MISLKINIEKNIENFVKFIVISSCKFMRFSLIFYILFFKIIPFFMDIIIFRYHDKYTMDNVIIIAIWVIILCVFRIPKIS